MMVNRKKIILILFILIVSSIYSHLTTGEKKVIVEKVEFNKVSCVSTFKSGTYFKGMYISGNKKEYVSLLPSGIHCEKLIKILNYNSKNVFLRFKIGVKGKRGDYEISVNGGQKYYGNVTNKRSE